MNDKNNNGIIFDAMYKMWSGVNVTEQIGNFKDLESHVFSLGYTEDDIKLIATFIDSNADEDLFFERATKKAFDDYIDGLKNIKEIVSKYDMEKGYAEMGNINLELAEHDTNITDEGVNVYEMDKETAEGSNQ